MRRKKERSKHVHVHVHGLTVYWERLFVSFPFFLFFHYFQLSYIAPVHGQGPSTVPPHHHNTPPALPIPSTSIPSASPSFPMLTHLPSLPSLPSLHHPAEPGTSGLGGSQEEIIIVDSSDDVRVYRGWCVCVHV